MNQQSHGQHKAVHQHPGQAAGPANSGTPASADGSKPSGSRLTAQKNEAVLGPFTVRDVTVFASTLLLFVASLIPMFASRYNLWNLGNLFFLGLGTILPLIVTALFVARRLSPESRVRVGSLSIDQFASVVASFALGFFFLSAAQEFIPVMLVGLIGSVGLFAATVLARFIPFFAGDFLDRAEVPAHVVARESAVPFRKPSAPKESKPAKDPGSSALAGWSKRLTAGAAAGGAGGTGAAPGTGAGGTGAAAGGAGAAGSPVPSGDRPYAGASAADAPRAATPQGTARQEPTQHDGVRQGDAVPAAAAGAAASSGHAAGNNAAAATGAAAVGAAAASRVTDTSPRTQAADVVPSAAERTQAAAAAPSAPEATQAGAVPASGRASEAVAPSAAAAGAEASTSAPAETMLNPQVKSQEPIGATVDPYSRPEEHEDQPVHEAFWFAVAQPRTAVDERTGMPAFVIEPGGWVLALEDRGHEFLVQHTDGRVGVLRDLSNIERG
ncbi:hypothetical protein TV39_17055 [Arthrobacter sp. SPG23]|uniref:ABC transporter permease n=1 Tax=Arthrobacter sp. SPG23 TaxID=1610703 RepID=UPI0005BA6C70|nr:ABC transporter permease [Arthrobacter sp. SPG23]KIS26334.1 hypothetical protein TV39_17055 [Arthrobacter sp. SPG23]